MELADLIRWMLNDAVAQRTMHIARELWAMALHDAVIRRAVDDFYDDVIDRALRALRRTRPDADVEHLEELVTLIAVLSEGSGVIFGTRPKRLVSHQRIVDLAIRLAETVVPELTSTPAASGLHFKGNREA